RTLSPSELEAFTQDAPAPIGIRATPTPPPTLDVTPTFVTLDAPVPTDIVLLATPPTIGPILPAQPGGDPNQPTATVLPTLAPTVALDPQEIPPTVSLDSLIGPPVPAPVNSPLLNFAITTGGGFGVTTGVFQAPGNVGQTVLFQRNPSNPDEYALVNTAGQLFVGSLGNAPGVGGAPFTEFTYQVTQRDDNNAAIGSIDYAANGALAFIIDAGKENIDGVWTFQGGTRQLLRDCPREGHPGCITVRGDRNASQWRSEQVEWATDGRRMIVELFLPDEGRSAFVLVDSATANPEILPRVYRYDDANWTSGGAVVISGIGEDGQPVIGLLDPNTGGVQGLYNGSAAGVYPSDAVQRADGAIVAFGQPLFGGGPAYLMDVNGTPLSSQIGGTRPARIEWSTDRAAALVQTEAGRSYIVNVGNGNVQDITGQVGNLSANFVQGSLPPSRTRYHPVW
ncbi:MAG: hypothetical protein AAF125_18105, partial [Chloroflexota bacterium]